jgi:fluoride exporter
MMTKYIYLGIGGLLGTFSRYWLSEIVCQKLGPTFPYGTLMVNLIGCFLIGIFSALDKRWLNPEFNILLMAGFCGAYTTFSAFMLETSNLTEGGEMMKAFLNIVLSLGLGFIIFRIGSYVGGLL